MGHAFGLGPNGTNNLVRIIKQELIEQGMTEDDIEAIVIGESKEEENIPNYDSQIRGKMLKWEIAKTMLDYEFDDDSYERMLCNPIYVWTKKTIMFLTLAWSSMVCITSVPRDPVDINPEQIN